MGDGLAGFLGRVAADRALWAEFDALCDFGGREAGSAGEAAARDWAYGRLAAVPGGTVRRDAVRYAGWRCRTARVVEMPSGRALAATALLGAGATATGGIELEVVDCGRGAPEDIAQRDVRGRAAMVRHEYPFASGTVHRRVKLAAAMAAGAAAFLIVQPEPGIGAVSGSTGLSAARGIPAFGLSAEAGERLARAGSRVHLVLDAEDVADATTETLVLDLSGRGPERVVLSAHLDGHAAGESALDNATGVAAALALARAVAPDVGGMPRGLTVCLFSAEEWALAGSRAWLAQAPERERIVFNLNLDSVAGASSLTALTSGFPALGGFVHRAVDAAGLAVGVHQPLMPNSDHANFASHGIPAMRLLAGFDEPSSGLRHLLTAADTRLLTNVQELKAASLTAGAILWAALQAGTLADMRHS